MSACLDVSARSADLLRAEIAELLVGETGRSATADPVLAAAERMLVLVDRACGDGPVVLVVEDLHWADEPSLLVWNRLARAVDQIPLLLVGSCRPVPYRPVVARLREVVRERAGTTVSLGPLEPAGALAIAALMTGAAVGPALARELSRAGGNPLYLRELVGALLREGLVELRDGVADVREGVGSTPGSLTAAIGRRLGFLGQETVQALRMAALLGNEFDVGEWCLALERPPSDLAPLVAEALAAHVLSDAGDHLSFRHGIIRQVLVEQSPAALRSVLHDNIAHALADTGAGLEVVARHLLMGSERIDRWAVDWLAGQPDATLYAAPEVSAQLLTRAAAGLDEPDPLWATVTTRLAQVQFLLGRHEPALDATMRLLRHTTDVERAASLRMHAVRSAGRLRRFADGLAVAEAALADEALPLRWRARLGAWAAMLVAYLSRTEEARTRAWRALADAEACADPLGIAYARHTLAFVSAAPEQLEHIEAALAVLEDDPESIDLRAMLLSNRLHRLAVAGRQGDLKAALQEALLLASRVGTYRSGQLFAQAAGISYLHGGLDEALVHAETIAPEFMENPSLQYVHALVALIALRQENRDLAEAQLLAGRFVGPDAIDRPEAVSAFVLEALALREEVAGHPEQALRLRTTWLEMPAGPARDARCDEALQLTRLALIVGERAIAEAAAAACQPTESFSPGRCSRRQVLPGDGRRRRQRAG